MTAEQVRQLALGQKLAIVSLLASIAAYSCCTCLGITGRDFAEEDRWALSLVLLGDAGLLASAGLFGLAGVVLMGQSRIVPLGAAIGAGACQLAPCLGPIALIVLNQRAATALRRRGIGAGLLGARRADLDALDDDPDAEVREAFD